MNDLEWRLTCDLQTVERFLENLDDSLEGRQAMASLERVRSEMQRLSRHVPHDPLLGRELAGGDTPLSLATIEDIGAEIGRREVGQPALLAYQHEPGVWPVRLGPGVSQEMVWKVGGMLLSTAEIMPAAMFGVSDFRQKKGFLSAVKTASALQRRAFEIRSENRRRFWLAAAAFSFGAAIGSAMMLFL